MRSIVRESMLVAAGTIPENSGPDGPPGVASRLNDTPAPGLGGAGRPSVSVVIPALNEEGSIGWVLGHLPRWVSQVVLVDGLSTDRTEAVARALWPEIVVVHQARRGKGAALRAGFAAATGDIVVMIDADGSTDPREMWRFVEALEGGADFVKGSRHIAGGGSVDFTRIRLAGNRSFVLFANILYRQRFTDLCYGYCAFWRRHVAALALTADGFEIETQLVLNAVKARLSIVEVPSLELERRAGSSNLNAFADGRRVLNTMLRERRRPLVHVDIDSALFDLREITVAAHDSCGWLPAGQDRRRGDRRNLDGSAAVERRGVDRRTRPAATSVVYRVIDRLEPPVARPLVGPYAANPLYDGRELPSRRSPGSRIISTARGARVRVTRGRPSTATPIPPPIPPPIVETALGDAARTPAAVPAPAGSDSVRRAPQLVRARASTLVVLTIGAVAIASPSDVGATAKIARTHAGLPAAPSPASPSRVASGARYATNLAVHASAFRDSRP